MPRDVPYPVDLPSGSSLPVREAPSAEAAFPDAIYHDSFIDLYTLGRTLRLYARLIVASGLLFLIVSAIFAYSLEDRYTATASFIPPGGGTSGASVAAGQLAQLSGFGNLFGSRTSGDVYVGLLRSRTLLDRMIARFNLLAVYKTKSLGAAEAELGGNSGFFADPKDSIVYCTITDHDPNRARDMANAYVEELQQLNSGLALTESSARRLFFEQRLVQEKNALEDAEVALKKNRETTGVIAPSGEASIEINAIAQLREQIASRRVRLAALLHDETDQNPDVLRLRSEIGNLEAQIAQMSKGKSGDPTGAVATGQVPALELDFVRLSREVKYHETLFDNLSRQYDAARLDEAHETPLQIIDHARTPDGPSGPRRNLYMTVGTLFGLLLGAFYAILRAHVFAPASPLSVIHPALLRKFTVSPESAANPVRV